MPSTCGSCGCGSTRKNGGDNTRAPLPRERGRTADRGSPLFPPRLSRGSVAETGNQSMDNELKAYLDQQFQQMRQETAEQFAKVDQRLDRSDQRQDRLGMDVRGVHAHGIDLLGQVRLVVESLANITQQLKRYDDKVSRELDEIRALNRLS